MADVQTSEVDAKLAPVNVEHEILYTDISSKDEQLLIRPFLSKTKTPNHGGRFNVKIHSLFCGDNS
jgi:hypothetical protein